MEVVLGALPSLLPKLGELLVGEYSLQKEVKGGIRFLQSELESMQGALEKISRTPADQLDNQDKIWANDVRDMSYDIEDSVDTFMVRLKGRKPSNQHGFKKFIDRSLDLLMQPKIRRKIATDIRDIKIRVEEVSKRRDRYKIIDGVVAKPVTTTVDPRLLGQYKKATELIGIERTRDDLIKIVTEDNEVSLQQGKIISIVGFGGLGKTTLANAVYEKIKTRFDCCAFVPVSQTPDMKKVLNAMIYDLSKQTNKETLDERQLIDELRVFLEDKRYLVVIDDIWCIPAWEIIRCALPDNNVGYRIITTTRILTVAEQIGGSYKLKPLCPLNSKILFNRIIFGNDNCPDEQLHEVSDKILEKCAGVPLAIITIASLLASKGKNKMEWYDVYNSVATGLENSQDVSTMRKVLSLSYYDLPSYLRTCLLYLTVFPEDYKIGKNRLISMWIAEGFIQCGKQESLFEVGESYFNELVNRSMIQPVDDSHCRVHDMVLDLLCSLSSQENFVTILNDVDHLPRPNVRRLSLHSCKADHALPQDSMNMQQVRSVVAFPSAFHLMPALVSFRVLRVLDLQDCDLSRGCDLKYVGNLLHLRYLGLTNTGIGLLPEEIGSLQSLQTLDVSSTEICSLPLAVCQLRGLMCLRLDLSITVPNGIGSLTCLEELSEFRIDNSTNVIEELDHLTELRVLHMVYDTEDDDTSVKSLVCKLQKIKNLDICLYTGDCNLDGWVAPSHIRKLRLVDCWFSLLPDWMNPSHLANLSVLSICVRMIQQKDLDILGKLQALRDLHLKVDHENLGILGKVFIIGACSFPCLKECSFWGFNGLVMFQQGGMPWLTSLRLQFKQEAAEITDTDTILDLGLGYLPSLQEVYIRIQSRGTEVEAVGVAVSALRHVAELHPNNPTVTILSQ